MTPSYHGNKGKQIMAKLQILWIEGSLADPRGGASHAPWGPTSFIFMQFSAKQLKNNSTFGSWCIPSGENPGSATEADSDFGSLNMYFEEYCKQRLWYYGCEVCEMTGIKDFSNFLPLIRWIGQK